MDLGDVVGNSCWAFYHDEAGAYKAAARVETSDVHLTAAKFHDTCYDMELVVLSKLYMSDELLVVIYFSDEVEHYTELVRVARRVLRTLHLLPFTPYDAVDLLVPQVKMKKERAWTSSCGLASVI